MSEKPASWSGKRPLVLRLHLRNFLSYSSAVLDFGDFATLVGPNSTGKSNAVAAIKLLRDLPFHGLPTAIARRGGFRQLQHRSDREQHDPRLRLDFQFGSNRESYYEIELARTMGSRYEVREDARIYTDGAYYSFTNTGGHLEWVEENSGEVLSSEGMSRDFHVPPGQSAVSLASVFGTYIVANLLQSLQTVEINPARVGDLQAPSSTKEFEPDGSNTASIYESLTPTVRRELLDELGAIVPGIERIAVRRLADKVTLEFYQQHPNRKKRPFLAKQMSDGTLRAFGILLSILQPARPTLLVVEEPEIAIHLGAIRTLVDILQQRTEQIQILITTHSADIVDMLPPDSLRVVWVDGHSSRISRVAEHAVETVRKGLITPGQLLRSDALDPAEL